MTHPITSAPPAASSSSHTSGHAKLRPTREVRIAYESPQSTWKRSEQPPSAQVRVVGNYANYQQRHQGKAISALAEQFRYHTQASSRASSTGRSQATEAGEHVETERSTRRVSQLRHQFEERITASSSSGSASGQASPGSSRPTTGRLDLARWLAGSPSVEKAITSRIEAYQRANSASHSQAGYVSQQRSELEHSEAHERAQSQTRTQSQAQSQTQSHASTSAHSSTHETHAEEKRSSSEQFFREHATTTQSTSEATSASSGTSHETPSAARSAASPSPSPSASPSANLSAHPRGAEELFRAIPVIVTTHNVLDASREQAHAHSAFEEIGRKRGRALPTLPVIPEVDAGPGDYPSPFSSSTSVESRQLNNGLLRALVTMDFSEVPDPAQVETAINEALQAPALARLPTHQQAAFASQVAAQLSQHVEACAASDQKRDALHWQHLFLVPSFEPTRQSPVPPGVSSDRPASPASPFRPNHLPTLHDDLITGFGPSQTRFRSSEFSSSSSSTHRVSESRANSGYVLIDHGATRTAKLQSQADELLAQIRKFRLTTDEA